MQTAWDEWEKWYKDEKYTTLPIVTKLDLNWDEDHYISSWSEAWQDASPYAFVMESGKNGRYTYLGIRPDSVIYGQDNNGLYCHFQAWEEDRPHWIEVKGKPLQVVREWMEGYKGPRLSYGPKFIGGCVGFWGYDIVRSLEKIPCTTNRDISIPDYLFMRMNEVWVIDHVEKCVYCVAHTDIRLCSTVEQLLYKYNETKKRIDSMTDYWLTWFERDDIRSLQRQERHNKLAHIEQQSSAIDIEALEQVTSPFNKKDFMDAVVKIQQYITQGDVFQVNLSQRQSKATDRSPEELYEWLRLSNPSPYMGYLKTPQFQLVSASPELLVELHNGKLATRPIAGTRRRGRTEEEEEQFVQELLSNEKEKAEHIMLVDLERNDLGRVSVYGSVQVKELMVIERYSHVMHLVSQIEGELMEGKDAFDVIAATFPGGTITGAPKIRTMEIIEELEPVRRGPYTGSMGWIDYNGDMEFNIIIRTMVIVDGQAHIQAGAGIVIDSDPLREYYESLNKAKALWKAIQYSETYHYTK